MEAFHNSENKTNIGGSGAWSSRPRFCVVNFSGVHLTSLGLRVKTILFVSTVSFQSAFTCFSMWTTRVGLASLQALEELAF